MAAKRQNGSGKAKVRPAAGATSRPFDPHVAGVEYGDLDNLVGYAVRRAQILIYEDFTRTLGDAGMTPQRYAALTIIGANPGLKQTQIGDILGVARSGAMLLVNSLEEMGYVRRESRADDKRSNGIVLTAAGAAALRSISAQVAEHDRRIAAGLDAKQRDELVNLLSKIGAHRTS